MSEKPQPNVTPLPTFADQIRAHGGAVSGELPPLVGGWPDGLERLVVCDDEKPSRLAQSILTELGLDSLTTAATWGRQP